MNWKDRVLLISIPALFVFHASGHQIDKDKSDTQTVFGLKKEVERPVRIPASVLLALRSDADVVRCLKPKKSSAEIPASWFAASEVRLNEAEEIDLVVQPKDSCLLGVNVGPFWVFRGTQKGYKLALKTVAQSIDILKSTTKGYRDILSVQPTPARVISVTFKFDGQKYVGQSEKSHPML